MARVKPHVWLQINSVQTILFGLLLLLVITLSLSSPFFWRWENLRNILDQSTLNIIIGVGMTLIISSGGIDLSAGAIVALSGVVMAVAMHFWFLSVAASIIMGMAVGLIVGLINGSLIALFLLNPFIVTLASMSAIRGLTLIITKGIPISSFPEGFTWFGSGEVGIFPVPVVIATLVAILGAFVLNNTKLGYYTLALGGNEEALRLCGVSTVTFKIIVYMLGALTAALAGLVLTARLNSADPTAGYMMELDAIATVVLGGTCIKGGRGSIGGTVLAGLLLAVLHNGLTIHGIASYYQQLTTGVIILATVLVTELKSRTSGD
ncbi:ABC transporter, permease [Moorella glycerini]|uniref:ABC transporter permease n=1 Tax=Neomoorella stamsii TaxID=1266720 RepID=UPI0005E2874E|nr:MULTISPECIES: ABC transporter permease [Moorella]CEP68605.1 ABC transporter, permease [Moorella glycerini]